MALVTLASGEAIYVAAVFQFNGIESEWIDSNSGNYMATYIYACMYSYVSLSTVVLNSRDWSEIVWLLEILHFKISLAIGFIRKNPLECIG